VSSYGSMAALIRLGTLPGTAALGLLTLLLTSPWASTRRPVRTVAQGIAA